MFKLIIFSLLSIGLSTAQILQSGQCNPNIVHADDFNIGRFSGKWNSIEGTRSPLQTGDCSYLEINPIGNTINAGTNNFNVYIRSLNQNFLEEITGTATARNETATYSMVLPTIDKTIDIHVMLTDYENFALAYSCENVGVSQRNVYIWQLGRSTSFPSEMIVNLMNQTIFTNFGLTSNDLTMTDHSEAACYELPVIPPGQSVILPGQCDPNTVVVQNFNVSQFQGVWHQIASYYSPNAVGTCSRAEYTLQGSVVNVVNSEVVSQSLSTISGTASIASSDNSARLLVTLQVAPGVNVQSSLWVLATDYLNYAVSYTCEDLANNQKRVNSWILSRTRQLPDAVKVQVDNVVASYLDLNDWYYIQTDQSDEACFYFPEPALDKSVVFPGQCDESIPVVANFSVIDYLDIWNTIEAYPSENALGSCGNARYTLGYGGVVDVYNTEVINQTLLTIEGTAVLASTDGSAKLEVTFPIAGTNFTISTNYWVLATDYESYALVYSCSNINNYQRIVYAWKLSRTKELSANASTVFEQTMRNISVLDERYFQKNDQSDEACFYYPEPKPNVPVVFRGQCDDSISAINNFNASQFIGTWYEVEAYPKDNQPGQCISHDYSLSTAGLDITSSSVNDQFLITSNSTVAVGGSNGRLTITIPANGSVITIPFWILSVNYEDYALAYSCVNLNTDYRAVYSWKLSRSTELSSAANTAINTAISNIDVLDSRYYEKIDHSADACFYLPELAPGEPVILNGQCDTSILPVANFNASNYQGRWRLIESYPTEFQTGTCNEARYTPIGGDLLEVVNSQVVNASLASIAGTATVDSAGRITVTFPSTSSTAQLLVLDTDYTTYSLVYSCENVSNNARRVWSWKMSRSRNLTENAVANINRVINNIQVLNNRYYEIVDQSDEGCFYYPLPGAGPVVFRGQCDLSIPAISNFNASAYLGLWHTIESYPSVFQGGSCNNAYYSLGTASDVNVYNTQVVNEKLDEIWGTADLISTDGTGKLLVSFPIAGTNFSALSEYWILDTDYTSYALVYTCVNVDEETRQVWSWKLGRNKTLTTPALDAIDNVIKDIPVLDQRYYDENDQSPDGCFYYPEPKPGVVVVFPGQCDESIQAVPNFNLTEFQGTWYEIQSYPKEQQTGQCINHEYSPSGTNSLSLITSYVLNQLLESSTSQVTFTSTQDTSGKLTVTMNSGGSVISFPFWILSTDYKDYALAYSCINIDDDYRRVFSWKLSRTQDLSLNATTAINNAISNITVLDDRYYENIDQSDSACFYLPNLTPNEPVILPGQCDPNITVVQNFNVTRYQGEWRNLATYYAEQQIGTCSRAKYTLRGDVVDLVNSQVINEALNYVSGTATVASTDGSAKLKVQIGNNTANLWILDTDYDTYSIAYNCYNLPNNQRRVYSWILSRTSTLPSQAVTNINRVIDSIDVLNNQYYQDVDQSDAACFYYPEPEPNKPVVFRGQCDENVAVVTNFNITKYMGQWYDVASYPSNPQTGTCNSAHYTQRGSEVDVLNTEVRNETLATATAVGRFAGASNIAKLLVDFGYGDSNYWVLSTDYTSYALVYSCKNIDSEHRQVGAWKLSRTRRLEADAEIAINNVMANVSVLAQQYYIARDHSSVGCFYYPEPEAGSPVIFPGQCDTTIQAMPNFNFENFQGLWHEIHKYPTSRNYGQCINQEFGSLSGSTIRVVSRHVENETLFESIGTATVSDAAGSGRLTITIPSDDGPVTIPFWILRSDYNNYTLAYGCVNINPEQRRVYSWMLGRRKSIPTSVYPIIEETMSNIQVLDYRYFEEVKQSDNACFYLPALTPNDPVIFPGQCDRHIPAISNFNATRYAGRWRLLESYQADFQSGTCLDATYTVLPNGTVLVVNTQVVNETLDSIEGTAVSASISGSGKLFVTFPNSPEPGNYWILDTDYDSFSLVYSCRNLENNRRRVFSWKLSRSREFTAADNNRMDAVIDSINVLNSRYYNNVDHSDSACFYYPEADGKPLIFRGQCDENITLVSNFNAADYLDTWYDIESYPTGFQFGTCPTATYTLNGNVVDVYNTEVVNQVLSSITGVAVPYPDGSSRLTVSFPIPGTNFSTESPYWILSTDYINYALVYSCVNIDEEHRSVHSWKLSRTRTLTDASNTEINQVINSVPVLHQKYYNIRGHTDEDCFYYPNNFGGPVILDGECESSTIAVQNFNLTAFAGTWHEVSKFPSELPSGECVTNKYEVLANQNAFTLTKTFVTYEKLTVAPGTATVAADGRGILEVKLSGDNVSYETTMYVIDVDYDDYALLYGCRNLGNNTKQIYSWILSRDQAGLSEPAAANIDKIVSETKDLFEGYYEKTDQSILGCFYYPEFEGTPGQIVLPGPCDNTIRGIANFNAGGYLGKWYQLASYPQPFQDGDCARAYYSTTDGVVVSVMNTQVTNRTLDVAYATAVVASTDGSGVLEVTFNFPGFSTVSNYYILDTDYDNYALVYSCRNIDDGKNRQVTSWKLSRDKTLAPQFEAAMSTIINNTQGLLESYYIPSSQSDEACFYIPQVDRDQAPVFRSQCDPVEGVQGFDIQKYLGWWHEIEAYPTDSNPGSCVSSEIRASGSTYQLIETGVKNNNATVVVSTLTASSNGRLRKTYSDGRVVDIWVLATDYETYSLLYSCENINADYKRVWSAKHSKARALSQNAQNIMSEVIAERRVLEPQFYLPVDQSDGACFHYPEPTGNQVILPGQCDQNIPVEMRFDAAQYTGTWYQTQRYPQPWERGNCTGARYSLDTQTGVVTLVNWEVVDGELDTIEGTAVISSLDGSARLIVTLPIRGMSEPQYTTMELYVLTTDYLTYSLAYSCVNVDPFRRAVSAWKLSRTRSMTPGGEAAIETYMRNREEFNSKYFITVEQSDECPEPSSARLVKSSIIVLFVSIALMYLS
ncbi:uncharacterized protein LOC119828739 [Zerene cesonia]|uniref:uncharacterized protein LOC119828739 n=1 Tax=Zerene cesonia TaxID=33412 RepID=UPI0018E554A3|nr:uncharacterized protein LOC119828739 [Zerene cesonia]